MHAVLLTLGFVRLPDGTYSSAEFNITVRVVGQKVEVMADGKTQTATIDELETAMLDGSFGDYKV